MEDMVEYPVYIKPSVGQGSKGQSVCYTREDADRAIEEAKKVSGNGEVVILLPLHLYHNYSLKSIWLVSFLYYQPLPFLFPFGAPLPLINS